MATDRPDLVSVLLQSKTKVLYQIYSFQGLFFRLWRITANYSLNYIMSGNKHLLSSNKNVKNEWI